MKTYEELCIQAEHRARLWSDAKVDQRFTVHRFGLADGTRESELVLDRIKYELWNAYQAGYKSGYDSCLVEYRDEKTNSKASSDG
jgi:hypothetical protein